jgi:hypothetical protein
MYDVLLIKLRPILGARIISNALFSQNLFTRELTGYLFDLTVFYRYFAQYGYFDGAESSIFQVRR